MMLAMVEDKKEASEFESLIEKATLMEDPLEVYEVSEESFNLYQKDIGFIMAFDKLLEHQKKVPPKGLRFDFLGMIPAMEEAIARNGKHYLKLQLQDIHRKTQNLCLFEETAHFCSVQEFTERYLLSEQHPLIFIQSLQWDGKYLSADKLTLFEHGEQHPKAVHYKQVEGYLQLKLLPKDNDHLVKAINRSCKQAEKLVQKVLVFMREQYELYTLPEAKYANTIISKIAEIAYSKTYTRTSYLLQEEEQVQITDEYMNYFLGQLQAILEMFVKSKKQPVLLSIIAIQCIFERWRREVVSLYEFESVQKQESQ